MQDTNKERPDKVVVSVLDRMRRLCARRECCTSEIYRKTFDALRKALRRSAAGSETASEEVDKETVGRLASEIMASLASDGFVDDSRYAAAFARDKSALSGWGQRKIRNALSAKGLSEDVIAVALEATDTSASVSRMEKVLEVKFRSLSRQTASVSARNRFNEDASGGDASGYYGDPESLLRRDLRLKMLRFALGRGYGYDEAAPVIERLLSEL